MGILCHCQRVNVGGSGSNSGSRVCECECECVKECTRGGICQALLL